MLSQERMLESNSTSNAKPVISVIHASGFEYGTLWILFLVRILNPLMRYLARNVELGNKWFERSSLSKFIKINASNYQALEAIYSYNRKTYEYKDFLDRILTEVWLNLQNCLGVRNRLRIVERVLETELISRTDRIKLASLGTGSARAVLEVLAKNPSTASKCSVRLVDLDPRALEFSKAFAEKLDLHNLDITWMKDRVDKPRRVYTDFMPDVIEMVGMLDYFDNERSVSLMSLIHENLAPGGVAIIANICPNTEEDFVTNIINWPMRYKTVEDLTNIVSAAGFSSSQFYTDKTGVHMVVVCRY